MVGAIAAFGKDGQKSFIASIDLRYDIRPPEEILS